MSERFLDTLLLVVEYSNAMVRMVQGQEPITAVQEAIGFIQRFLHEQTTAEEVGGTNVMEHGVQTEVWFTLDGSKFKVLFYDNGRVTVNGQHLTDHLLRYPPRILYQMIQLLGLGRIVEEPPVSIPRE